MGNSVTGRYYWTTTEIKLVREHYPRGGAEECMKYVNRTRQAIQRQAHVLGVLAPGGTKRGTPYPQSDFVDAQIRKLYQGSPKQGDVSRLAERIGRSRYWISYRAVVLGVSVPIRAKAWSRAELDMLRETVHIGPHNVRRRLREAGYHRTPAAIESMRKRMALYRDRSAGYSAYQLADVMGVDSTRVIKWIRQGKLRARRDDTEGCVRWLIRDKDVRMLIIRYTAEVDIRRIDKFYLVDLLSGSTGAKAIDEAV